MVLQQNESSVSFCISCVYIDSILYVYLYPPFFLLTLLYHSKLNSQRTISSTTAQCKSIYVFKVCLCVHTCDYMLIILLYQFIQWWLGGLAATLGQSQNTQSQSLY